MAGFPNDLQDSATATNMHPVVGKRFSLTSGPLTRQDANPQNPDQAAIGNGNIGPNGEQGRAGNPFFNTNMAAGNRVWNNTVKEERGAQEVRTVGGGTSSRVPPGAMFPQEKMMAMALRQKAAGLQSPAPMPGAPNAPMPMQGAGAPNRGSV